jgi:small-conductance mechanosensitive channel
MEWTAFKSGTLAPGPAAFVGVWVALSGLALSFAVLRPLLRVLAHRGDDPTLKNRRSRLLVRWVGASLALGLWATLHGAIASAERPRSLGYETATLAMVVLGGFALLELPIALFCDFLPRLRGREPVTPFFKDVVRAAAVALLCLGGVKAAFPGADIGALLTTSAILSVVVGLALQESLSNIFAGLMLTIDKPFKAGEWVDLDGREGKVLDSNWRSTRILTRDDDVIYVPNSTMAKVNVINLSASTPDHLCRRKLGVEYGAPPNKVRNVLVAMMGRVEGVLAEPAPEVYTLDYADFAIIYEMRFWIRDYERRQRIESEVMRGVWYALKREGISIPFPIRDVYLRREKAERKPEELIALLRRIDILQPLKEADLALLADDLSHQLFARGEPICRQGEPGTTFNILKSGLVSVKVKAEGGVEAEVARLGPGSYFGEMSLLTGEPRSSTVFALEDCEVLCLDRDSFAVLLQENPPVAQAMSDILATRVQATRERLSKERDAASRGGEDRETTSRGILEKIRTIFRFPTKK